ncbi:MAG: LysR family transcriptional regulator [Pseudomonadota bacterium]
MNLSTRQMRAFVHVARIGSFTRAAEQAHMTQAGLSILVREMERQLGCRLFDRTTRMVVPTPAGQQLLPVAERLLADLDDVVERLGAEGAAARQTLRIAATPLVSSHLLPQVFASFRQRWPQVQLRLFDAGLDDVQALVAGGEADLGLGFFFKAVPGLERQPVGRFHLMRVAPAEVPATTTGTASWTSLRAAPLIGLPASNPIQKTIDRHLADVGLADPQRPAVNFFGTLISMVESGFGTAVMPTFAVTACRLHRVSTDVLVKPRVGLEFYRITKRGGQETEAMAAFLQTLEAALPALSR